MSNIFSEFECSCHDFTQLQIVGKILRIHISCLLALVIKTPRILREPMLLAGFEPKSHRFTVRDVTNERFGLQMVSFRTNVLRVIYHCIVSILSKLHVRRSDEF